MTLRLVPPPAPALDSTSPGVRALAADLYSDGMRAGIDYAINVIAASIDDCVDIPDFDTLAPGLRSALVALETVKGHVSEIQTDLRGDAS